MRKTTIWLISLSLGGTFAAQGQVGAIRGTVVDSAQGVGLSSARVTAINALGTSQASALTDARGRFRLTGLASGGYDLIVTRIGYRERLVGAVVADTTAATVRVTLATLPVSLDPIVVTPSRSAQTSLDAPAATSVVDRREIEQATVFTPVDAIRDVTGVDFASKGLLQHTFAVRGDRSANSGALLFLTDHRLAAVPSIGFNVPYLIPATSHDIERIEVTRGPGAALYGPDADRGVVHVITRSPFESRGGTLSLTAGERSLWQGSGRYATTLSPRFGFKISAEYFRGMDWEFTDSVEAYRRALAIAGGADPDTLLIGRRDFAISRAGGEAQAEWRPADSTTVIGTFGVAQAISNIDLAPDVGGIQAQNWRSSYIQGRLQHGRLFAHLNYNWSDAGQTYQLRTGARLVDQSRLLAAQVQHSASIRSSTLLYGFDARWADPRTGGTIHGRNEDDDRVTETGAYVHATTPLARPITLVAAVRADYHNRLNDLAISPRLGLLFRVAPTHVLRLTYNRGFNSPDPSDLFVDIKVLNSLAGLPYAVRVGRVPQSGYAFRRDCGGLCMRSPFNSLAAEYLPPDATRFWLDVVAILGSQGIDISDIPAPTASQVASELRTLNLNAAPPRFDPVAPVDVADFGAPRRTITDALELGYKAVIGERVRIEVDGYRNRVRGLMGELITATPNVFHQRQSLEQYLANYRSPAVAAALAGTIAGIPLGIVSPEQSGDPLDVLLLRRQGGAYTIWGVDFGVDVRLTEGLTLDGSYSWLSDDSITNVATVGDVVLSVPKNKGAVGLRYADAASGLATRLVARAVSSFPVISGVYSGRIDWYALVDAGIGFPLPGAPRLNLTLDAYNLPNKRHREYVGAPELGRLLVIRLQARL